MKIDKTVLKETAYVTLGTFALSGAMILVYSLVSSFEPKALYGALLGSVAAILNFFFMAYTLQRAVETNPIPVDSESSEESDEEKERKEKELKEAKEKMKMKVKSQYAIRNMVYLLSLVVAIISGYFNVFTLILPALFPSIVAKVRMIWLNKHGE